jgi:hypothetical protein
VPSTGVPGEAVPEVGQIEPLDPPVGPGHFDAGPFRREVGDHCLDLAPGTVEVAEQV